MTHQQKYLNVLVLTIKELVDPWGFFKGQLKVVRYRLVLSHTPGRIQKALGVREKHLFATSVSPFLMALY